MEAIYSINQKKATREIPPQGNVADKQSTDPAEKNRRLTWV